MHQVKAVEGLLAFCIFVDEVLDLLLDIFWLVTWSSTGVIQVHIWIELAQFERQVLLSGSFAGRVNHSPAGAFSAYARALVRLSLLKTIRQQGLAF